MTGADAGHDHIFLHSAHDHSERRTWAVIALCGVMMVAEIGGGLAFGSVALVADGLHMFSHVGALLIAAFAYAFARRHASDGRFSFGTGKIGDLAGFVSALVLAATAMAIGYEAGARLFHPVAIDFGEAIPIALAGLLVNIASAWLLAGQHHHDGHHHHQHGGEECHHPADHGVGRDNNMRAAVIHVAADAVVSILVIAGLLLARHFGWLWLDPLVGLVGALVIGVWAWGLVRATGAVLLDMMPDRALADRVRRTVEADGDQLADLHVWRLGPGHLGAILSVVTPHGRDVGFYRQRLAEIVPFSHLTVEVSRR